MWHRAGIALTLWLWAGSASAQGVPGAGGAVANAAAEGSSAQAAAYKVAKPHRQFITISYDWLYTQTLNFADHPLAELVGKPVSPAQFEAYDYRTSDGEILIDVLDFTRRTKGAGVTIYPLGASTGATLALRASFEDLPDIRVAFAGPNAPPEYALVGARAYDVSAQIYVADHAAGWGLGSHAFVGGGVGRVKSDARDGKRYFAEGGGGLSSGPLGVELAVKVAWNHFDEPVDHHFMTIPVTLRGTISF
jgi:hypothetical protein